MASAFVEAVCHTLEKALSTSGDNGAVTLSRDVKSAPADTLQPEVRGASKISRQSSQALAD